MLKKLALQAVLKKVKPSAPVGRIVGRYVSGITATSGAGALFSDPNVISAIAAHYGIPAEVLTAAGVLLGFLMEYFYAKAKGQGGAT